jgi:hypothetical protein
MIILAALKLGKPSILAKPDWKKAMRMSASYEDLEEQDLYDILAACSVLLAERDTMSLAKNADSTRTRKQRDATGRQACGLLLRLHQWRQRWDNKLRNSVTDTPARPSGFEEPQSTHNEDPQESLITVAAIPNLAAAMVLMLYNLALMYVLQSLAHLPLEDSATRSIGQQSESAKGHHVDERVAAREICHCIQYYLHTRRRLDASASPIVHWAVAEAWTRLRRDDSIEAAWIRDLLTSRGRQVVAEGLWTTYKWLNSLPE